MYTPVCYASAYVTPRGERRKRPTVFAFPPNNHEWRRGRRLLYHMWMVMLYCPMVWPNTFCRPKKCGKTDGGLISTPRSRSWLGSTSFHDQWRAKNVKHNSADRCRSKTAGRGARTGTRLSSHRPPRPRTPVHRISQALSDYVPAITATLQHTAQVDHRDIS